MVDASAAGGSGRRRRALVADESSRTRMALGSLLGAHDPSLEILEAATGLAARDALVGQRPDIAFVTMQLPGMTGAEALAYARMQGIKPLTVLMSTLVLPKWEEVCTELDVYEFLKKPFDPDHVADLLRNLGRMNETLSLLLVEDSSTARALVRRVLQTTRFKLEVDETESGQHAVKLMKLAPYDVALVDFNLIGGMDGLETACQAREVSPDTKVILMSGSESPVLAQAAHHFGVKTFLKKPFYARDVDHALHSIFDLRRPYLLNAITGHSAAARAQAR